MLMPTNTNEYEEQSDGVIFFHLHRHYCEFVAIFVHK
jgi:hypothetical protein